VDELTRKMKAHIDALPVVDVHSHLDGSHPDAKDARQILFYHYIVTELVSAGIPQEILSPEISVEESVRRSAPYFRRIRNTTTHWCLMQMLRDLYEFEAKGIDESNWRDVLEAIQAKTGRKDWYREILGLRTHIEKTFLTWDYRKEIPRYDRAFFVGSLRVDPLVQGLERVAIQNLEKCVQTSVASAGDLEHALELLVDKFVEAGCRTVATSFQPSYRYKGIDESSGRSAVRNLMSGDAVKPSEKICAGSFVLHRLLATCQEHHVPFQIMIGAKRPVLGASPPDYAIAAFEQEMISSLCPMFYEFRELNFDIFLANRIQSHELAVIAKNYPNVHVSGYWWYTFYPTVIREFLRERLQMLPRNKVNAFFSDAYVVQWSYAKLALVRLELARVLSEMVREGYLSEELAEEMAADVLYGNPTERYGLG